MPLDHDEDDYNKDYDTMIADTLQNGYFYYLHFIN